MADNRELYGMYRKSLPLWRRLFWPWLTIRERREAHLLSFVVDKESYKIIARLLGYAN